MNYTEIVNNWNSIPENIRDALLSKIWCEHCEMFSAVGDVGCRESGDNGIVCGHCIRCGSEICRPVPVVKH